MLRANDSRTYPQAGSAWKMRHASPSEQLAIDDESGMLRHLIVKLHRGEVGLVGLPVHARRSGKPCAFIDAMDQRSAHALTAGGFGGEQILQIADGLDSRGAAVKQVVCQAEQLSA